VGVFVGALVGTLVVGSLVEAVVAAVAESMHPFTHLKLNDSASERLFASQRIGTSLFPAQ